MINPIKENIWQFCFKEFGSCVYLIKIGHKNIIIDTSSADNKKEFIEDLNKLNLKPEDISMLILTHNHHDHIENIKLFKNAIIYGNKKDFPAKEIESIENLNGPKFKIIQSPGHTQGSICIYMPKEKVLFSGDTLFENGIGRTDFPESSEKDMKLSLKALEKIDYNILCPGHI
ncbi:MAG: MBL fold metallo-hydrolase [Nanoarchaeota archaeon]|nr:MBL fold metallo-hydrolase [Nanoarchaeota archaeon]